MSEQRSSSRTEARSGLSATQGDGSQKNQTKVEGKGSGGGGGHGGHAKSKLRLLLLIGGLASVFPLLLVVILVLGLVSPLIEFPYDYHNENAAADDELDEDELYTQVMNDELIESWYQLHSEEVPWTILAGLAKAQTDFGRRSPFDGIDRDPDRPEGFGIPIQDGFGSRAIASVEQVTVFGDSTISDLSKSFSSSSSIARGVRIYASGSVIPFSLRDPDYDAKVEQQLNVLDRNTGEKLDGHVVVFAYGSDEELRASDTDRLMSMHDYAERVVWVTAAGGASHVETSNERIRAAADRHDDASLLDWAQLAAGNDDFYDDGELTRDGRSALGAALSQHLEQLVPAESEVPDEIDTTEDCVGRERQSSYRCAAARPKVVSELEEEDPSDDDLLDRYVDEDTPLAAWPYVNPPIGDPGRSLPFGPMLVRPEYADQADHTGLFEQAEFVREQLLDIAIEMVDEGYELDEEQPDTYNQFWTEAVNRVTAVVVPFKEAEEGAISGCTLPAGDLDEETAGLWVDTILRCETIRMRNEYGGKLEVVTGAERQNDGSVRFNAVTGQAAQSILSSEIRRVLAYRFDHREEIEASLAGGQCFTWLPFDYARIGRVGGASWEAGDECDPVNNLGWGIRLLLAGELSDPATRQTADGPFQPMLGGWDAFSPEVFGGRAARDRIATSGPFGSFRVGEACYERMLEGAERVAFDPQVRYQIDSNLLAGLPSTNSLWGKVDTAGGFSRMRSSGDCAARQVADEDWQQAVADTLVTAKAHVSDRYSSGQDFGNSRSEADRRLGESGSAALAAELREIERTLEHAAISARPDVETRYRFEFGSSSAIPRLSASPSAVPDPVRVSLGSPFATANGLSFGQQVTCYAMEFGGLFPEDERAGPNPCTPVGGLTCGAPLPAGGETGSSPGSGSRIDLAVQSAYDVGLRGEALVIAVAIAGGESNWTPDLNNAGMNRNGTIDYGLWQINTVHNPPIPQIYDPLVNAQFMMRVSNNGTNWRPWVVFNKGLHLRHMETARGAIAQQLGAAASGPAPEGIEQVDSDGYGFNPCATLGYNIPNTGRSGAWGGHQNGRIPQASLCRSRDGSPAQPGDGASSLLECNAARAFAAMNREYESYFGYPMGGSRVNAWGYRDYQGQVATAVRNCGSATSRNCSPPTARPGSSNHGWGLAVDMTTNGCGTNNGCGFKTAHFRWLQENAHRFGFFHPEWARQGSRSAEYWHWEFPAPEGG